MTAIAIIVLVKFTGEYMAKAGLTLGVQCVAFAVDQYGLKFF